MKAIYLVGFMGAGKSTVGPQLAKELHVQAVDTDQEVEKMAGKTISQIFADEGEKTFRQYEKQILQQCPTEDAVIITGGGMVLDHENIQWMKQHGLMFYLYCHPDEVIRRLQHDQTRPLIQQKTKEEIYELWEKRQPFYRQAHYIVRTEGRSVDDIVKELVMYVNEEEEKRRK